MEKEIQRGKKRCKRQRSPLTSRSSQLMEPVSMVGARLMCPRRPVRRTRGDRMEAGRVRASVSPDGSADVPRFSNDANWGLNSELALDILRISVSGGLLTSDMDLALSPLSISSRLLTFAFPLTTLAGKPPPSELIVVRIC